VSRKALLDPVSSVPDLFENINLPSTNGNSAADQQDGDIPFAKEIAESTFPIKPPRRWSKDFYK
jgi:hypothetical protein